MFKSIINNTKILALTYFILLVFDVFIKFNAPILPYRYVSKFLIILFLIAIIILQENWRKHYLWVFLALICFYFGDVFLFHYHNDGCLICSILLFSLGKIFLSIKFSHKNDFNTIRLIPFAIIIFGYVIFLVWYLYSNLDSFFVPVLVTFFLTLVMLQLAFLRKDVYNKLSYRYVFIGAILFVITESIVGIEIFKIGIPYIKYVDSIIYGSALYFIVIGVLKRKTKEIAAT